MASKKASDTPRPLGENIRMYRDRTGLSVARLHRRVLNLLPDRLESSDQTLYRLENGFTPEDAADPVYLAALAQVLDVPLQNLSPEAAADRDAIVRVLTSAGGGFKSPGNSTPSNHTGPGRNLAGGSRPTPGLRPSLNRAA